jgi:hypothetical protein
MPVPSAEQGIVVTLPPRLAPFDDGPSDPDARRARPLRPATPVQAAPRPVVNACRTALAEAAAAYGAVKVDVASRGAPRRSSDGGLSAPMEARIVYSRKGRMQVRQARVTCQFDLAGTVVAAL